MQNSFFCQALTNSQFQKRIEICTKAIVKAKGMGSLFKKWDGSIISAVSWTINIKEIVLNVNSPFVYINTAHIVTFLFVDIIFGGVLY